MVGEQVKVVAEWWMRLCTGRNHDDKALDEESYRERVLVMASGLWIAAGSVFCVIVNIVVDLSPEGRLSANLLFAALILGMLGSMVLLRASGSRLAAVNVVLLVFGGGLASSCFIFGGTSSPTYLLLMMVPLMGSIAGNVRTAVSWGVLVALFWIAVMVAEKQG
ncbi:MAG: hypothetical protein R3228_12905, partial [Halioglobus sp.]|nr:hypothetical protein [Halioglobus sp.]